MKGINIGGVNINNLRYADDTVLLTEGPVFLQALLKAVNLTPWLWWLMPLLLHGNNTGFMPPPPPSVRARLSCKKFVQKMQRKLLLHPCGLRNHGSGSL